MIFEAAWSIVDNRALDCVGLARSRLSVGEYGSIVALHAAVCNWLGYVVEDGGLVYLFVAYEIEYELFGVESSLQVDRALIHLNALALALLRMLFLLIQRAHSNAHLDVVLLVLLVIEQMVCAFLQLGLLSLIISFAVVGLA